MALPRRLATKSHHPNKLSIFLNASFLFLVLFYLITQLQHSPNSIQFQFQPTSNGESTPMAAASRSQLLRDITGNGCTSLHDYTDYKAKCVYVKSHASCKHKGIVSFTRTGDGDVGLNSILGGAFFVSSVVVGIISISISPDHEIIVDRPSFIRDVLFFLFSLSSLLVIVAIGRVSFWSSIFFVSIYLVYVCTVSFMHFFYQKQGNNKLFSASLISNSCSAQRDDLEVMGIPLLGYVDDEKSVLVENGGQRDEDDFLSHFSILGSPTCSYLMKLLKVLELPLQLPRKLTIPIVKEEGWSKPYAVISVTLAPILLAALCNSEG
ncbi:hypothetical protein NL676_017129 [Syzygium grande]|nr:hypothetical protein NL676_017129 [Syzygium grande]